MPGSAARVIEMRPTIVPERTSLRASRAFVVLLRDEGDAKRLESELHRAALEDAVVVVPPVRGVRFFADPSPALDRWWGEHVPADAEPVYILRAEPGIVSWTLGLDGDCVVGVSDAADVACYGRNERVRAVHATTAADYVGPVVAAYGAGVAEQRAAEERLTPRRGAAQKPARFRRARLDADIELRVAVPERLQRPPAPRHLLAAVDPQTSLRGSEAFFTPTGSAQAGAAVAAAVS